MSLKQFLLLFIFFNFTSSCVTGLDYHKGFVLFTYHLDKAKQKIKLIDAKKLDKIGKIYTYKNYLFITDNNMGVHIFDNTDPKNPINKAFLVIPFNEDISIKNNILYADSLDEIIAIDLFNLEKNSINITKRIKLDNFNNISQNRINSFQLVIGQKEDLVYSPRIIYPNILKGMLKNPNTNIEVIGQGGSLSRFSIVENYLYTVTNSNINVFSLKDEKNPEKLGKVEIEKSRNDVETIYSYKDKLFMGSRTGAYIYDNSNPQKPTFLSKIEHIRSCDPVVVENDTAYVTLRNASSCRGGSNELDIVDIKDIKNPKIQKNYPLNNPWGLAIKDSILYVCDYMSGLKIYNAKDSNNLSEIKTIPIQNSKDIIVNENNLGIVITDNGIYEYDFSNFSSTANINQLSLYKKQKILIKMLICTLILNLIESNNKKEKYYNWYKEYLEN